MRRSRRVGVGAGALAATLVAIASFAVTASPLPTTSPAGSLSSRLKLLHRAVIYAKEGSKKLVDGRWNLSQSETKLGIALSPEERQQLLACTGEIVCKTPDVHNEEEDRVGRKISASAASVLRPDLLVTAKHVFFRGKTAVAPFGSCSFRSYARRNVAVPVMVEKDQRTGYRFNNEDFIVLRLKRGLEGCKAFALGDDDAPLREGDQVLAVTGHQLRTLNKLSGREPLVAKGRIRRELEGVLGGPPFYYADVDFDVGGSGGAVFALTQRAELPDGDAAQTVPLAGEDGRLILKGMAVGYGPQAKSGRPYSDAQNYTIVIGLQGDFRELVLGKAATQAVEPAPCAAGGEPKIDVVAAPAAAAQPEALAPMLQHYACGGKTKKAKAECKTLAKGVKLATAERLKAKQDFTLKNATSCRICFTYDRCNDYGCWEQAARLAAKSSLSAGAGERLPAITNAQFCK